MVLVALAVLGLAIGVQVWRARSNAPSTLHTVQVRRGTVVRSVVATGRIEPKSRVEVKSKVNGIVKALPLAVGDPVTEGEVVAELDKEVAEARVREMRATLQSAKFAQTRMRAEASSAERDFARSELGRVEELSRDGIISVRETDKARADYRLAVARHDAASAAAQVADAEVARATALLDQAENELRFATILSPLTGIVLARQVDVGAGVSGVGSLAGMGSPIVTVGDVSELHVVGQVDEIDIGAIALGMPARIRVDAFRDRPSPGAVTKIASQGTERNKVVNFEIEVAIRGEAEGLRPNMTADAEVIVAERSDVLVVPEASVVREGDRAFVERPTGRGDERTRVEVRLGLGNGADVEVVDGLAEGDVIVGP
jgi:HlyD family secretion protein